MRILVFDDGLIAARVADTLADAGHEVLGPVTSADEAMALAAEKKPQLAFVDINPQGIGSGQVVARRCDELGIATMFLTGSKASLEEGESGAGLLSDPQFLNNLIAVVEYIHSEGRTMLPGSLQLVIPDTAR
jgi:CheY-like chemotaxis protein